MWRASCGEIAHGDAQARVGIAGRIGEGRMLQANFAGALGQHLAEGGFVAGQPLGDGDAGIVGGIDDDAVNKVIQAHLAMDGREHGRAVRRRPTLAPGVLADGELLVELELALLELIEDEFQRHQLGKTCRLDGLVGVLLEQNAVGLGVEQDGVGDAGLKRARRSAGGARRHTAGGEDRHRSRNCHQSRCCPDRPAHNARLLTQWSAAPSVNNNNPRRAKLSRGKRAESATHTP